MGIFRQFPYSNFHDMNLDWIMKTVKQLAEEWAETHTEWEEFKEYVLDYFKSLDVSAEILKQIRTMLNNGEFNAIINTYVSSHTDAWLNAHITPETEVVLDSSFTLANASAESQAVGYIARNNRNLINLADRDYTIADNLSAQQNKRNGSVRFIGTAQSNVAPGIFEDGETEGTYQVYRYNFRAGTTYALSGCPEGGSWNTYCLNLHRSINGEVVYSDLGNGIVFTPTEDVTLYLQARITTGNGNGLIFKPQIEVSHYVTPFVSRFHKSAYDNILQSRMDNIFNLYNNELSFGGVVNDMMRVTMSYINHGSELSYGQETATHWYINHIDHSKEKLYEEYALPTQIDCSTLALLVIQGTPYEASKYAGLRDNIIGFAGYGYDIFEGDQEARENTTGVQSLASRIARYALDKGFGFEVSHNSIYNLQPGDMLFFYADTHDPGLFLGIDHCEIYLGKASNMPTDDEYPMIVTLNCSGGREIDPVQINYRGRTFYDGTNPVHRSLVFAARFPVQNTRNANAVSYFRPNRQLINNMPFHVDRYKACTVAFDGYINTENGHFTIFVNGVGNQVCKTVTNNLLGQRVRYKCIISCEREECNYISIRAIGDSNALITNVWITEGVNI